MDKKDLPEICYHAMPKTNTLRILIRGEDGYIDIGYKGNPDEARAVAEKFNHAHGITKAQEAAMLGGALFGWGTPCADPARYDENGSFKQSTDRLKRAIHETGEAR